MRVENYDVILKNYSNPVFIDVRSQSEFLEATIPNSINIPILDDLERKIVGTLYKEEGTDIAIRKGVEIMSKKLLPFFDEITKYNKKENQIVLFCARGGMRSSCIGNLLSSLKFNIVKLNYGYKGYRQYINRALPEEFEKVNLIVLHGKTGTGKTEILKALSQKGENILDLEGYAKHRGSTLGSISLPKQSSQKMFESLLFEQLINRNGDTLFIEGESKRIGNIILPDYVYNKMQISTKVLIENSLENRIEIIKKDYITKDFKKEELITKIKWLSKYISKENIEELIREIEKENYNTVIEKLMVEYYDIKYNCYNHNFVSTISNENMSEAIIKLLEVKNESFIN